MAKFLDATGRTWNIELNVGMVSDIQDTNGVDLDVMMTNPEKFTEILFASPKKLAEMLYVVCESQAVAMGVSPAEFAHGLTRVVLDQAADAFLEAVIRFYPRSSAGRTLGDRLPQMLAKMDREIIKKTNEHLDKELSDTVTNSPVSSGSTPLG